MRGVIIMNNTFFVDIEQVKNELNNFNSQEFSEQINSSFLQVNNFNNNWKDSYKNNSDRFNKIVEQYKTEVSNLNEELNELKNNILKQMEIYEEAERNANNW